MTRTQTALDLAAAQARTADILHLLALEFSGGTVRFTTGPTNIAWDGHTWAATHGMMSFEAVTETPDYSGQRLRLILDGVSLDAITAFLAENYIGRFGTLYRAHFSASGLIIADPMILFLGYMNAPWAITEDWESRSCTVSTELVSPLALLDQVRGITADPNSHQRFFASDTFFSHIATKEQGDFGWGFVDWKPKSLGQAIVGPR